MNNFSAVGREQMFKQAITSNFDIIVIGGGITGAGIALDASAKGLQVAVFEMQDFAAGTSSRSTKLIHGGLRYLKQLEINVVAEVGKERAIVYENGPHITTPEWMLLPLYKGGTFGKFSTRLGLTLYDFLARVKRTERKKMLSVEQSLQMEPLIKKEGLVGGGYYVEYKTDDARLTIEVMKKAVQLGAKAVNYAKVTKLLYESGNLVGVRVEDLLTGNEYSIFAKKIINATGPWVDEIRQLDQSKQGKTLMLTKGVHLVFDHVNFPLRQAIYFDTPDGRMCFAIPRDGKTYFGTTDTKYDGDKINPIITEEDVQYLLQAANYIFPSLKLNKSHIESSYAGLRPLIHQEGKGPSEVSRKDEIFVSPSGLISIAGGKLTGYRKMAEQVVTKTIMLLVKANPSIQYKPIDTKHIRLSGGDVGGSEGFANYIKTHIKKGVEAGFTSHIFEQLIKKYGSNIEKMYRHIEQAKHYSEKYNIAVEEALKLLYALHDEMALYLEDYFERRTGYILFDVTKVNELIEQVSLIMAEELNWNETKRTEEVKRFKQKYSNQVNIK